MDTNTYRSIVPTWQVELINRRARRRGFRPDELDDLQQQIVPHLAAFQFDPNRSHGATLRTALVALIDQQLKTRARTLARYRRHVERQQQVARRRELITCDEPNALRLDVGDAVAALPAREQAVCKALAAGSSIADVAAQLHCSWHAVRRLIRNIRARFEALGLGDWVGA
jgi:DNA-binding CsgD family transcriptional regulator